VLLSVDLKVDIEAWNGWVGTNLSPPVVLGAEVEIESVFKSSGTVIALVTLPLEILGRC
jgi:hypothetical protein